ncbi:MAG: caspase family protein [Bacteroidales bacterium]|nr:caspase family protein [Bacteroidales bacterium]
MKKTITKASVLACAIALAAVTNGNAQCISGNCADGYGVYQNDKYRYVGFFDNGFPNGYGVMHLAEGDSYVGEFKDGHFYRHGVYCYAEDGARVIAYWTNGHPEGPAEEILTSGKSYRDYYVKGEPMKNPPVNVKGTVYGDKKNGFSVTIFDDGSQYVGYNVDGKRNGWGTLTKFDGSIYTGEFKDDQFNGYGSLTTPDGGLQEGMWENDRFVGELRNQIGCVSGDCQNSYSVLIKNGDKYIGEFKNGQPHGMGKYILADSTVYTGSVVMGRIDGSGTLIYPKSDKPKDPKRYFGEIQDGKPSGYGAMTYQNGDIYYGKFTRGEYDGQGVYIDKESKTKKSGLYYKGSFVKEIPETDFDLIFGSKDGYGLRLTEGGRYTGNLIGGEPSGAGMLETYNGLSIYGEFDEGMANGQGMCEDAATGSRYIGQFRDNKMTGRGSMYYANGTKQKGYFKDGKLTQEVAEASGTSKPEVSWVMPQKYSEEVTEGKYTVKICVGSTVPVSEVAIYDNKNPKINKATRGYIEKKGNDLCNYSFEFDIALEPGRNELKAVVKNDGGSTTSEPRYVSWVSSDAISSQKRVALLIGNGNYQDPKVKDLKNAANDALLMSDVLKSLGFEVMTYTDIDRNEMREAVYKFGDRLKELKAVGLFFYAGHGIQVDGVNYLVPTSASLARRSEVEEVCFSINKVLGQLAYAQNDLNIVILDACRDDPFAASTRSINGDGGLAQINAPKGTLIAYSTSPGKTAYDGDGKNGLYTEQLAIAVKKPGDKIEQVFKNVRNEVYRISHEKAINGEGEDQIPWENSSIFGEFYFVR